MPINTENAFLQEVHPVYTVWKETWQLNERRTRAGDLVLDELKRFDWEKDTTPSGHYALRQSMSTYINFPDMFASTMVGHMMKKCPKADNGSLDFGGLGKVRRTRGDNPTRAELLYYNADGVGNDGSQWDNFWATVMKWAAVTGHRWVMAEGPSVPAGRPLTKQDELRGLRPYLVHFSPLSVTNWHIEKGELKWCVLVYVVRRPKVQDGKFLGNVYEPEYLLMVRRGVGDLGSAYNNGGWWKFNSELNAIEGESGDWNKTRGEIPMFPVFYERDTGEVQANILVQDEGVPNTTSVATGQVAMSRPAVSEIGNAAVAYMNLSSAADFDAWDAAMSLTYIIGVDEDGFKLAAAKLQAGSRMIPLPINRDSEQMPSVFDGSTGTVSAEVFKSRLDAKLNEVGRMAVMELSSGTGDPSGMAMQAEFAGSKAPRLALMASELEQAQNTAIRFMELRWGVKNPTGSVTWPREFSLVDVLDSVNSFLALQKLAGVMSKTLTAKSLVAAARSRDLISDEEEADKVKKEYEESAVQLDQLLTPDGAQSTGDQNGVGGDGTAAVPGQKRLGSVGSKSPNHK